MSFFCKYQELNFQSVILFSYDFCLDRLLEKKIWSQYHRRNIVISSLTMYFFNLDHNNKVL